MYHFNKHIGLLLLLLFFLLNNMFSQNHLPRTIIIKVKESYRNVCKPHRIAANNFEKIAQDIQLNNLEKMFPNKAKSDQKGHIDLSLIYQLSYSSSISIKQAIHQLMATKLLEYAEPYYLPQLTYTPNDPQLSQQYYLGLINAYNAWNINQGDSSITIGITDTGWETTHPDLINKIKINYNDPINGIDDDNDGYIDNYLGWDLGMNDNSAQFESTSHGVAVTGIAAAQSDNGTGIASVGFKSTFLPIKISNATGILTHAYQGIVYAADQNCFIINCSWGSYDNSLFQEDIVNYAQINKGALVIAAAGNDNSTDPFYPAAYNGVIAVAASDQNDIKKNNSNHGYYLDITAPGESIFTTVSTAYGTNSGTSMATPMVAGAAAIVKNQFPSYTAAQVAAQLKATTDNIDAQNPSYIHQLGTGRLNLFKALNQTNVQFADISSTKIVDNNNEIFDSGDTLSIITEITNYLQPINGLTVTLSSFSPFVTILNASESFPILNMLDTASNYQQPFKVRLLSGIPLNEPITFQATITNGTFSYQHFFTITVNPDFLHLEKNLISTTITSKGKIGFNDENNLTGKGFVYKGKQLLYEAGLMAGNSSMQVSDAVRGVSAHDQDFGSVANVAYHPPYVSALDLKGLMDDLQAINPLQLGVQQISYAYTNAPNDHFVIIVYEIENQSNAVINNLHLGIFADWDILQPNTNKAGTDINKKLAYCYALDNDSTYVGIQLLTNQSFVAHALDVNGSGTSININDGFTTAEKFTTLSINNFTAGGFAGDDVGQVASAGNISLLPSEKTVVGFALLAGDSLLHLQQNADAALVQFNNDALQIDDFSVKQTPLFYPNPTKNWLYFKNDITDATILVKDVMGKPLSNIRFDYHQQAIDVSSLANGAYFIQLVDKNKVKTYPFIKH